MKLALLSNHETSNGLAAIAQLLATAGAEQCGAFIASQPDTTRYFFNRCADDYASIGHRLDLYLDFEDNYSADTFEQALTRPFIHLSGGNTFRFLAALRKRNAGHRLVDYVRSGGIVIGVSAGAMLLTPSIESALLCGDSNDCGLSDLAGLNLVSFLFDAHSLQQTEQLITLEWTAQVLMARDDDGILLIDDTLHLIGAPKWRHSDGCGTRG